MRLGIMSFAHLHAEGYIDNLRQIEGVSVLGFSDTDPKRGHHFADAFNTHWFESHEALLTEKPDGVIICSENAGRRELVEMAAEAGVHVLCEKPIEVNLKDAEAMHDACERNGVMFMTAFPMRFDPSIIAVKGVLERGDLGRVYGVNGVNHSEIPLAHRAWFTQRALAGGGAVMDHTVHLVDLLRWYFDAEVSEVFAEVGNPFYPGEVDVDTAGLVTLTLSNNLPNNLSNDIFATIDCSWSRPTAYPRWGHLKMELFGERGSFEVDALSQHLTVYSQEAARQPTWHNWGSDPNQLMLEEFVASMRENRQPSVGWQDGYEALRVALACYESAESGQPVKLQAGVGIQGTGVGDGSREA